MKSLIHFAKHLRKNSTDTENRLWSHLRSRRFAGLKFRRQQPIGRYIADFVSFDRHIIIECDGGQHLEQAGDDAERDQWFVSQGYKVLRFWNHEVMNNLAAVLEVIHQACMDHPSPDPFPSKSERADHPPSDSLPFESERTDHPPSDSLPSREGEKR